MSSERALELGLVEAVVAGEELEAELLRRVKLLSPR
jgi:enoyl-CoA hydratase/carnithine racemase